MALPNLKVGLLTAAVCAQVLSLGEGYKAHHGHGHSYGGFSRSIFNARTAHMFSAEALTSAPSASTSLQSIFNTGKRFPSTFRLKMSATELSNEEIMENWLEEMIFSGDMETYVRKHSRDLLCEEFLEYLQGRVTSASDEDERNVAKEALSLISKGLSSTDGLGQQSGIAFESRLDQILFTPPNQRRAYIESKQDEMTTGFVEYVQKELKTNTDEDSKVVLASILKLIGEVKGSDLLGGAAVMLTKADASLGEEFAVSQSFLLASGAEGTKEVMDRNEQILAYLTFSTNDILEDVLNNLHEIDERFVDFLQKKTDESKDMEERIALGSLQHTITNVLERIKEVQGEGGVDAQDEELTMDQVKQRMQDVQMGAAVGSQGQSQGKIDPTKVFSIKEQKTDTFKQMLSIFKSRPDDESLADAVLKNYDLCDYEFMEMLKVESQSENSENRDLSVALLSEITKAMAIKMGSAQERLQKILSKGRPQAMESEVVAMSRKGEIDEALILLIEANIQQAQQAGPAGKPAVEILTKLIKRANEERERKLPDEQRLLRAVLRLSSSEERKGLLYAAFKPVKSMNQDGEFVEDPPLIAPPAFIAIVKQFIRGFGNVDSFNIMARAQEIIEEAQAVATDLYGEGMTPREQQDMMFKKNTVSVWDLARYEEDMEMQGQDIPWRNDKYDNMDPEDVIGERIKRVGGQDGIM